MKTPRPRRRARRSVWPVIMVILSMIVGMAPNIVPGIEAPTASAHNLNASVVYVYFDPDTQSYLDNLIDTGQRLPGQPLLQSGDELGIIIKVVPDLGTTTGVGGYTTFYIPNGLQVMDAAFILPGDNPADGIVMGWDKISAKGQARMPAVGAGGDSTVSLVGVTRGPNILGVTSPIVDAANKNLGTLPGVYGDTGIFYSTAPETAFGTYSGGNIINNSGDTVGARTILGTPLNKWDAWQMAGFGIKGTTNPAYPSAALIDANQRGYAPWGFANVVAGPQSGYAWGFNFETYSACDPTPTTSPDANCIDLATQATGPWQRIRYPGGQFADDPPGNNPPVQPYVSGTDASDSGFDLTAGDLPITTGQADGTPNAVRWAFGQLTYNVPEYAWVKVRVVDPAAVLDATGCPVWTVDTFGGDAGGDSGGKDHIWRYYDPNSITFNGCLAIGKPATREIVKVGDVYQYRIKLYNAGTVDLSNVVVRDTLPSGVQFLSAVPAQSSGPNPLVWNVGALLRGQKFEVTVTVKTTGSGLLTNQVIATGTTPSSQPVTAIGQDTTLSGSLPLLNQNKSVSPPTVAPAGQATYTIDIKNIGSGPTGSPVALTEYLPAGFTYAGPLVNVTVNGADVTAATTVNASNPNQPVFSVPGAIDAGAALLLSFKANVAATVTAGAYCNSYTSNQNGINLTTGALACVEVGGAAIGDTVYRDWNANGTQDAGEEGIAGAQVCATGPAPDSTEHCATTDADGKYLINGLPAGAYSVDVTDPPAGYTATQGAHPTGVTLAENEKRYDVDFGYQPGGAGAIGDLIFEDVGNDGAFDSGTDTGIANVTVWLYEDTSGNGAIDIGDTKIMTATSDVSGIYGFSGLATGLSYIVDVDEADPDLIAAFSPNPFTNSTPALQSVPNLSGSYLDADFGYFENLPSSIGDTVFIDQDGDGVYAADVDTPLANVTVTLYRDSNGDGVADGPAIKVASTDPLGQYLFDSLGPDTYLVIVDTADPDLPTGLNTPTTQHIVSVPPDTNYLTADFPFRQLLIKTASPAAAQVGGTITFTLRPYYGGGDLLQDVRIIDPLPTGTTYVAASANAGGAYGAYAPIPAEAGYDPAGGPAGSTTLDTTMSVSANFVNVDGSVSVTLTVKQNSGSTVDNVTPVGFEFSGGSATCAGPTPASANVPTGVTGSNFVWACTLHDAGEYIFSAAAEDATTAYSWPAASSASVLSAPDGGPNVVTWSLGSNAAATPGEIIISGYAAGVYAFRGGNTKEFSKYSPSGNMWTSKAQPTNGIEKGGSLTGDGAGILYGLEGNSKIFYKYNIATDTWTQLANTSDNVNEGGAVQYLDVGGAEYVFAVLGGSNRFRRYSVSGNSWSNMANTPANVRKGGALTTDGTYIYALQGDRKTGFWRYDPGANTWTALVSTPGNVGWGGALTRIGNDIYATRGDGKPDFWRYDIAGNTWSSMASAPGNVADGGGLTTDGVYVYALQGKTKTFWRYNPATNTWSTLAATNFTGVQGQGGALVYDPGVTPVGRFSDASATPTLVSTGDTVKVTIRFESSAAVNNVVAETLNVSATGGATHTCGSPVLLSADDDIVDIDDPVVYEWTCPVTAGPTPGSLTFDASATGAGPTAFPTATANSVLVSPALSFQATVDAGAPAVIENTGLLVERSGILDVKRSNTTETSTSGSIGDRVWVDLNGDGAQDTGEPGLPGVTVDLYDSGPSLIDTTTTDSNGLYHFYGVPAGSYTISYDLASVPAGYLPTTPTSITYTLTSAEQYTAADFGLRPPGQASIGDTVWIDANEDGVVDGGETRLPNVTIELYNSTGTFLLTTTTTDANGVYTFPGLHAGDYVVQVDESSVVTTSHGVTATIAAAMNLVSGLGGNTVNPANPVSVNVPTDTSAVDNADFGYNWSGAIGDLVWYDEDRDQIKDGDEAPIAGAVVLLYYDADGDGVLDPEEYTPLAFMATDANGLYTFEGLPPGDYLADVYEDSFAVDGQREAIPTTPDVRAIDLGPGEQDLTVDFGYYNGALIEGHVFWDADRNGLLDPGETRLTPVTVSLTGTDNFGSPVTATATTDASGRFFFLTPAGTYTVTYSTPDVLAIDPALGDTTTPISYTVAALAGPDWHVDLLFGVDNTGTIGDTVWNDADADGAQNAGEPGLGDVTVQLYRDSDSSGTLSAGDTFLAAQVTDATGHYLFEGLADDDYVVVVNPATLPADFGQTYDNFGALDDTGQAAIASGAPVDTVDFGYRYSPPGGATLYTISGRVYNDLDNNGNDDTEPGFASVAVTVTCDFDTLVVPTDSAGAWAVAGIPAGSVCTVLDADESDLPGAAFVATETPGTPITVNADLAGLDFGYHETPGSIAGAVCDGSGNGLCTDPSDQPIQGVTVTLRYAGEDGFLGTTDDTLTVTQTNASGAYTFPNLEPGLYQIAETNLPGYVSLADRDGGNPDNITVNSLAVGQDLTGQDFEDTPLPAGLALAKTGPAQSWFGASITYTFTLTNTGTMPLADVAIADPLCSPVTLVSGDTDGDAQLDLTETWTFTCAYVVQPTDPDPLVNTATASGIDLIGRTVTDQASWSTDLVTVRFGDMVWVDTDSDEVYDVGTEYGLAYVELPVTGLTVNGTSVEITVTTSVTGYYRVDNLVPGTYTVTAPATASGALRVTPSPRVTTLTPSVTEDFDVDFAYYGFTGVKVLAFQAGFEPTSQAIRVAWTTADPCNLESFLLYRAPAPDGPYDRITPTPITAAANDTCHYEYLDLHAKPALAYWYKLQALSSGAWHGPIASSPDRPHHRYLPLVSGYGCSASWPCAP